jgi:hypothetical protein
VSLGASKIGLARRALAATLLLVLCGSASAQQEDLAIEQQGVARRVLLHRPPEAALLVKLGYHAKMAITPARPSLKRHVEAFRNVGAEAG